jgi:hypothetical protein
MSAPTNGRQGVERLAYLLDEARKGRVHHGAMMLKFGPLVSSIDTWLDMDQADVTVALEAVLARWRALP